MTDAQLALQARNHHNTIKANAAYAQAEPTHMEFDARVTALENAMAGQTSAEAALRSAVQAKDAARLALEDAYRIRGSWAERKTGGDPTELAALLFQLREGRRPSQPMPQLSNLAITAGDNSGEMDFAWDRVENCKVYEIEVSSDGMTDWALLSTVTASKATISSLASGAILWFRVRARGALGPGPWSEVASRRVP